MLCHGRRPPEGGNRLDMHGVSLSVLAVDAKTLERLDAPCWTPAMESRKWSNLVCTHKKEAIAVLDGIAQEGEARRAIVLQDGVAFDEIAPYHISEQDMVADPFTKYLIQPIWARHMWYLLNRLGDPPVRHKKAKSDGDRIKGGARMQEQS